MRVRSEVFGVRVVLVVEVVVVVVMAESDRWDEKCLKKNKTERSKRELKERERERANIQEELL